jgi:hypothetical protein
VDKRQQLFVRRLEAALQAVPELGRPGRTGESAEFKDWRQKVQQTLDTLFGERHEYSKRFRFLNFRMLGLAGGEWYPDDQAQYDKDLHVADSILKDALEEIEIAGLDTPQAVVGERTTQGVSGQVYNLLHQATTVDLSILLSALDDLPPEQKTVVEQAARDLKSEVEGAQRWPELARSLETIRSVGKSAYERVAIPLVLELLKKQTGL